MNSKVLKTGLLMVLIMSIILTATGCSFEEWKYYSLSREINQLNASKTSGVISVALGDRFFYEMQKDYIEEANLPFGQEFDIKYTGRASMDPLAYEINLDFRNKGETEYKKITTIIGNDKVMYFNMRDFLSFIKPYVLEVNPSEEKVINALIEKVEYIKVDLDSEDLDYAAEISKSKKLNGIYMGFAEVFMDSYSSYTSDAVSRKGNGYELRLSSENIKPIIINFIKYTVANIDSIVKGASSKINSMSDEEISYLAEAFGDPRLDRASLLFELENFKSSVGQITTEQIDEINNDGLIDMMLSSIEGSVLTNYIEKEDDNNYKSEIGLEIKYNKELLIKVNGTSQVKKINAFSIAEPAQFTTIEEMQSIVASVLPPQARLVTIGLQTKNTTAIYSDGKTSNIELPYSVLEGYTFVSLDAINKIMGTQITWNEAKQTALVEKDGEVIELKAMKINGKPYIKVAELEKLDYLIWFDVETREVNILNPKKQSIFQ